jgi:hypothetical protein
LAHRGKELPKCNLIVGLYWLNEVEIVTFVFNMQLRKSNRDYPCFNKSLKNIKGEKWLEIPFTEGYYLVSNFGRVKALARYIEPANASYGYWTKDKILSQSFSRQKNRYKGDYTFGLTVTYQFNSQRFSVMARRLVYEAFLQPLTRKKNGEQICISEGWQRTKFAGVKSGAGD